MTCAELIEALKKFPPDMPVVARGYEDGWEDAEEPSIIEVEWDANPEGDQHVWYYGRHGDISEWQDPRPAGTKVVRI